MLHRHLSRKYLAQSKSTNPGHTLPAKHGFKKEGVSVLDLGMSSVFIVSLAEGKHRSAPT